MTARLKTAGAVLLGLVLASLPFMMFGVGGGHSHRAGPHMDHAARHGGQLGMVGDYHLELVRNDGRILVYASDALRRPVTATRGVLVFNEKAPIQMSREPFKLTAPDSPTADDVTCTIWLEDGTRLELTFGLDATSPLTAAGAHYALCDVSACPRTDSRPPTAYPAKHGRNSVPENRHSSTRNL